MEREKNEIVDDNVIVDERDNLEFVLVGDRVYRVFNKKTQRFHDAELGIDLIF